MSRLDQRQRRSSSPSGQHRLEQRIPILEMIVEAALGDVQTLGQYLNPDAIDPMRAQFRQGCIRPGIGIQTPGVGLCRLVRVPDGSLVQHLPS